VSRTLTVPAWHLAEGDLTPSGARIVSVTRDPSAGRVRIGLSTGNTLNVPGERLLQVAERVHDEPARRGRVLSLFTAASRIGRDRNL